MSVSLIISPLADSDLKSIHQSGIERWGQVRSAAYIAALIDQLLALQAYPNIGRRREDLHFHIWSLPIASYVIFVLIVRVLHFRQDPAHNM